MLYRVHEAIERIVENNKLIGPLLCIAQAYQIMGAHPRTPELISALSTAYNAAQANWKLLAGAMASLSGIQREAIFRISGIEYHKHFEKEMNRELGKYWKGIKDAAE